MSGTPARRARRTGFQRLVIVTNVVAVAGFLFAAATLAYGYDKYGQIPRVEIGEHLTRSDEDDTVGEAENFLIVGVDSAEGLDPDDPVAASRTEIGGLRSDTMMVLRVEPASTRAALLSLPRDLYVPIAGDRGRDRLNAAVQIGGPELLVKTIQNYLGIPINHYVQVDFYGFGQLVSAIDGVPVYFPNPVRDLRSGLDVPEPGCVTLDPRNALGFVRARAYQEFIDGGWRTDGSGDLGRIRRQQRFIVAALERSFDQGLRNPVTLDALIDSAIDAVTVDDTLDAEDLLDLAREFRRFEPEALDIYQLPVVDDTVGGAAVLRLVEREAEPILDVFRNHDPAVLTESSVRVRVLNGTGEPGQAAAAAADLREAGFAIGGTGDASRLGVRTTEVRHPPGQEPAADLVARWLEAGARTIEDDDIDGLQLVTGADWEGLRDEPLPAPDTTISSTTMPRPTTTTEAPSSDTTIIGTIPTEPPEDVDC